MLPVSYTKFIGRGPELQALKVALEDTRQARGQLVVVAGDAGIGKTRLAEELERHAQASGVKTARGVCYEYGGAPAFWPWTQVLRDLAPADGDDQAAWRLPELDESSAVEQPAQARFRLFDTISASLRQASQEQPLLILLDDLHWADKPSLLLLEFFVRNIERQPIMVMASFRDFEVSLEHPLAHTLGLLVRLQITLRIELTGLSRPEVLEFLQAAGGPADEASAERIHADTGGNPLFIGEMVRLAPEAGSGAASRRPLPRGIQDIISRRLQGLSPDCRRVLEVASVLGSEFSLGLLGAIAAQASPDVLGAVGEAERAHLLESAGRDGQYAFSHALVQRALHDSLTTARRLQLHGEIGAVLEGLLLKGADIPLAELAYHLVEAAALGEPQKAIEYALRAGQDELRTLGFEQAALHFGQALRLLRSGTARDRARELDVLLLVGEAQRRAGDRAQAKERFVEAAALARDLWLPEKLAEATLGYGAAWVTAGSVDQVLVDLIQEALAGLHAEGTPLRGRLLSRLAQELYYTAGEGTLDGLTTQAVEEARASGDPRAVAAALASRHQSLRRPADLAERLAAADEMVHRARLAGDDELALQGHHWKLVDLVELGDPRGVDAEQERCLHLAAKLRQPYHDWWTNVPRATLAMLRGDFEGGAELARAALAAGQLAEEASAVPFYEAQLFVLQLEGRLPPNTSALRDLADRFPTIPVWRAALAWLQADTGQRDAAAADVSRLFNGRQPSLPRDGNETIGLACLASAACTLGDVERAGPLYDALLPYAELNVHTSRLSACFGPAGLFLGELATLLRREADAALHLDTAIAMCSRMGWWPWLARAQLAYGLLLAKSDPQAASDRLKQAHELASRHSMTRLVERIAQAADTALTRPGGLTARESEILGLLADGLTSQEISERLVLSVHTVNRHVANIYVKIGARGRADATAFAFRHGLAGKG